MVQHIAAEDVAMGNIQTIWSAVADEVNHMVKTHKVAVGESVSAIEELHHQMTSARADLEAANQQMNRHRTNLDQDYNYIKWVENHSNFIGGRVTTLKGDWGTGRFSKHLALCLECNSEEFWTCREGRMKKLSLAGRLTT